MWPPEVGFVSPPEETHPESEAQLGDQTWRIEGFTLVLQGLLCTQHLIPLRVLQAHAWLVIPTRAELITESLVNLIAQGDLKSLYRSVKGLAKSGIPRIEPESPRSIAGSDGLVALQPLRRYGTA
jgi:hypothetical protein